AHIRGAAIKYLRQFFGCYAVIERVAFDLSVSAQMGFKLIYLCKQLTISFHRLVRRFNFHLLGYFCSLIRLAINSHKKTAKHFGVLAFGLPRLLACYRHGSSHAAHAQSEPLKITAPYEEAHG